MEPGRPARQARLRRLGRGLRGRVRRRGPAAADAFAIHHAVQGSGSSVDVAAAIRGGLLRFSTDGSPPAAGPDAGGGLQRELRADGPTGRSHRSLAHRADFVAASAALVEGYAAAPMQTLQAAGDLLEAMAERAGIAYRTPALDRIRALARACGGAAKASGAGGGDCAIALLPDPDARSGFVARCASQGLAVIPVEVAPGAHRDSGAHA